ncbi:MAG: hypothetical protein HQL20_09675 [Candidatus Omnitrophica bacterium]|nr:hypothetical protein [Candidatus Omnitrophota bacterium]
MMKKWPLFLCFVMFISGCATCASGPLFAPASPSPDKKSVLYVYRNIGSLGVAPTVKINGKPFVVLTSGGYSYAYLSPGIYKLTFQWMGGLGYTFTTQIEIKPGEDLFEKHYSTSVIMEDIPADQGLEDIKQYRYVPTLNSDF